MVNEDFPMIIKCHRCTLEDCIQPSFICLHYCFRKFLAYAWPSQGDNSYTARGINFGFTVLSVLMIKGYSRFIMWRNLMLELRFGKLKSVYNKYFKFDKVLRLKNFTSSTNCNS